ncbi:MAG: LamG domain-containing protein [Thermodesulfobacteriota bacterium]|nr:LamG domain-containing protein [Thermodesulfobacteriota bacterium]
MNKIRHSNQWVMPTLLSMILGVGILFAGCGKAPQAVKKTATKVATKEPTESLKAEKVPAKEVEKAEVEVPAQKTVTEKTPLKVELHPPFLHLTMDDNAANPAVLDISEGQYNQFFRDMGGNPNTSAHSVPGVFGTALVFDGIDDSIVIPAAQVDHIFAAGTDFSVAFWWRSAADPFPDGYRKVLSKYSYENGGIILYQRGNAEGTKNRVYMNFYVAGNGAPILSPSTRVLKNIGRCHHYVFLREGSTLRAWCDGALQGSYTSPVVRESMGSGVDLSINSFKTGAKGIFDDLRIYPRALSKSEIRGLMITESRAVDLFFLGEKLCDLKANPASNPSEIELIESVLQKEFEAQNGYPKRIGDNVELLAFRYSHVEGDEYEMAFAFRTNAQLEKDYHIYIHGVVDPFDENLIPKHNGKPTRLQKWGFAPDPVTSAWSPGDVIVLRNRVKAAEVPYQMSVNFMYQPEGWTSLAPKFVPLGWLAAL